MINICNLCNFIMNIISYSFGDTRICYTKIELDSAILIIILGIIWLIIMSWWLIPIRFVSNKYLKNIVFECNKK